MRMWMLPPKLLCAKHLGGEHNELHKLAGCITRNRSLRGYIVNNFIELKSIVKRHDELAEELVRRGGSHNSPLPELGDLPDLGKVDLSFNEQDLRARCASCDARFLFARGSYAGAIQSR